MWNDTSHEAKVIEAVRLLRQARTLLTYICGDLEAVHEKNGRRVSRRDGLMLETLQRATKRISSTYGELEKLVPRRPDRSLLNFPHESPPQTVKWGGGPPPQWVYEAAEQERLARGEPPTPPEPPPED
jgi:hypothetical protein